MDEIARFQEPLCPACGGRFKWAATDTDYTRVYAALKCMECERYDQQELHMLSADNLALLYARQEAQIAALRGVGEIVTVRMPVGLHQYEELVGIVGEVFPDGRRWVKFEQPVLLYVLVRAEDIVRQAEVEAA